MRVLAAAGPRLTPPSTRCIFIVGQPKTIALKYPTGKNAVSPKTGKTQRMYTLTNGERAWFDLDVADAIDALKLAPSEPVILCHLGGGNWDVERGWNNSTREHQAPPRLSPRQSTARVPAPQPPHYWGNEPQEPPTAADHLPSNRKPAAVGTSSNADPSTELKTNGAGQTSAAILAGCYPHAIEVALAGVALAKAKGLLLAPTFEDVRCIATTLFINQTGGRG